jgi:1-acyl-sn-glycerol-3-phosphate acyltransferase
MTLAARIHRALRRAVLPAREQERLGRVEFQDAGHGFDLFGFEPDAFGASIGLGRLLHHYYFRVESHGVEHVPATGTAILAANHSGLLPVDAALIVVDVFLHTEPPRVARAIGDLFIPFMPWVGTGMNRVGMVSGTRENFRYLLEHDELCLVFPEGTPGIGKGFSKRYQLQSFRVGHAELALRHGVPIVPVAVIGAEESWVSVTRIERFHWFGAPFLPLPATPFPLPIRHHIHYGQPIRLERHFDARDADDPRVASRAAELVRERVAELITQGLALRRRHAR